MPGTVQLQLSSATGCVMLVAEVVLCCAEAIHDSLLGTRRLGRPGEIQHIAMPCQNAALPMALVLLTLSAFAALASVPVHYAAG